MSKGSSIVFLSSLAARAVVGTIPAYAATKSAVDTLVKHFAEHRGEMLYQSVDGALGRCIRWNRANDGARGERREENDAASLRHDRKELLHEKERCADVDREEPIEI